jgi:hypothetical protein
MWGPRIFSWVVLVCLLVTSSCTSELAHAPIRELGSLGLQVESRIDSPSALAAEVLKLPRRPTSSEGQCPDGGCHFVLVGMDSIPDETFAEVLLPKTLRASGYEVVSQPKANSGYSDLFVGGLIYEVVFRKQETWFSVIAMPDPAIPNRGGGIRRIALLSVAGSRAGLPRAQ